MSIRKICLMGLMMLIGACSSDLFIVHNGNMPSKERVEQIKLGQTKEQVIEILGSPSSVTGLNDNHWIYMSSKVKKVAFLRPQELERNIMALSFKDGVVSKIEHYDLADGNDVAIDQQTSASANDKVGFWRKYFGGVGSYSMFGKSDDKDL